MVETQERPINRPALEQMSARAGEVVSVENQVHTPPPWAQKADLQLKATWTQELNRYAREILQFDRLVGVIQRKIDDSSIGQDDWHRVIADIEASQQILDGYANEARAVRRHFRRRDPDMFRTATVVWDGCYYVHSALEHLRWLLLDAQAESDVEQGRHESFSNMAAAIARLKSIGD